MNVDYRLDGKNMVVNYYAGRNIKSGDELLIYYGNKLWFVDAEAEENEGDTGEEGVEEEDGGDGENFLARMEL